MNTIKDTLEFLPQGCQSYTGHLNYWIRFIEDYQLLDSDLWATFVEQFRGCPDDDRHAWRCEYWGKMMRGAAMVYRYTQNPKLYAVMTETINDLLTTQDEYGRISTYSLEQEFHGWDLWGRKYVLLGLEYFLEICDDRQLESRIKSAMCRHADYIMSKIGPADEGKIPITIATNNWLGLNSCSILEPYVRLYTLTGERKYLDFASYIVSTGGAEGFNLFQTAYEGKLFPYQYPVTKAYEMMSCMEGLLEYYRVTGEEKYKIAVTNFIKRVAETDISIIGCAGCAGEQFNFTRSVQTDPEYSFIMQETCVTVTWMKTCTQLLRLTGEAWLGDYIERSIYNALIGAINSQKLTENNALPFDSYAPLILNHRGRVIGGRKTIKGDYCYGCCAAIGAAGMGLIPEVACMSSADGIALNLYLPGKVEAFSPTGAPVTLDIDTTYPVSGEIKIRLHADGERFKLRLRIPKWSKNTSLTLDGVQIQTECAQYAVLENIWSDSTITLSLDMRAQIIRPFPIYRTPQSKYHIALRRGPVILARDARLGENIQIPVDITYGVDGYVELAPSKKAGFDTLMEFTVPDSKGSFTVIDYASAGKTWSAESLMTVWMPTKKYWDDDLSKPLTLYSTLMHRALSLKGQPQICDAPDDKLCDFALTLSHRDGKYLIQCNGNYLSVREGMIVTEKYSGHPEQLWEIRPVAQNRLRLYSPTAEMYLTFPDASYRVSGESPVLAGYSNDELQVLRMKNF